MSTRIFAKRIGINQCYVVQGDGCIMIDTGPFKGAGAIVAWLDSIPVRPEEIGLLVLTHGHADHVGAAAAVNRITGARIALHADDRHALENGAIEWPAAVTLWGRVLRTCLKPMAPLARFPKADVDVALGNEGLSLEDYGIAGRVLHTPGHTPGSVSVLLETGDAFVGCMAHNGFPFRSGPGLPIFAEDLLKLRASWGMLLEQGATTIYPGHGRPFPSEAILGTL